VTKIAKSGTPCRKTKMPETVSGQHHPTLKLGRVASTRIRLMMKKTLIWRDELDNESDDTESEGNEETTGDYETANSGYDGNEEDSEATDR
jgi:hypothetical protein